MSLPQTPCNVVRISTTRFLPRPLSSIPLPSPSPMCPFLPMMLISTVHALSGRCRGRTPGIAAATSIARPISPRRARPGIGVAARDPRPVRSLRSASCIFIALLDHRGVVTLPMSPLLAYLRGYPCTPSSPLVFGLRATFAFRKPFFCSAFVCSSDACLAFASCDDCTYPLLLSGFYMLWLRMSIPCNALVYLVLLRLSAPTNSAI